MTAPSMQDSDFEPRPYEREYYIRKTDGQRGWLVKDTGKEMIRLDRGEQNRLLVPFTKNMWKPMGHSGVATLTRMAKVAFEADKELQVILGRPMSERREWASLRPQERAAWSDVPTFNNPIRDGLYRAIMEHLSKYASG